MLDLGGLVEEPRRREDPLWRAQLAGSDFVALARTNGLAGPAHAERERLLAAGKALVFDAARPPPLDTLLREGPPRPTLVRGPVLPADRFTTLEWSRPGSVPLDGFRRLVQSLAPRLVPREGHRELRG